MTMHNLLSENETNVERKLHKLATYGTLKQGKPNSYLMNKQKFVGSGKTVDNFTLHGLMVFKEPAVAPVRIDLYEVEEKHLEGPLDSLESNGKVYNREKTKVILDDGTEHEAWLYFGLQAYAKSRFLPDSPPKPNADGVFDWGSYKQ